MVDTAGSELGATYSHNLILGDDHNAILEEPFTTNTRPDNTGQPFPNAVSFFTQFQYNPNNVEGQLALDLPLGAGKSKLQAVVEIF